MIENREHHYYVTRVILPGIIFSDITANFVDALKSDKEGEGVTIIKEIWNGFAKKLPPEKVIPDDGIEVYVDELEEGVELVTIAFPEPEIRNETYFTGLVKPKGSEAFRVFSLERSINPMSKEVCTMLTENSPAGRANFGPGPEPTRENFRDTVKEILSEAKPAVTVIRKQPSE